jgi:hypothetical protein
MSFNCTAAGGCPEFLYNPAPMANPEHVALLLSQEWNAWRGRNPHVTPDFTDADLSGQDLGGKDLKRADCSRADFSRASLAAADFSRATLVETRFAGASAGGAIFEHC